MFVEKLEDTQYGWSSTLKGKEADHQAVEGTPEARTYRACICPMRK